MIDLEKLARDAETELKAQFDALEEISFVCTKKVLNAFAEFRVSEAHFAPSTGYGYNDRGREAIDGICAKVFGAEKAIVRHQIVNGTQALAIGLYGLLRPGDTLLSVAGKPYDTLEEVIGIAGNPGDGSLKDFGIDYEQVECTDQ